MEDLVWALLVPVILFIVIIAPAWLWMHYRSKAQAQTALSANERAEMETLILQAERMLERIETLEAILDAETPDWRKRPER